MTTTPALNDDLVRELIAGAQSIDIDGTPAQVGPSPEVLREAASALGVQAKEIEALRSALEGTVAAWDVLPGDRNYGPKVIENWIVNDLAPAFRRARSALTGALNHG